MKTEVYGFFHGTYEVQREGKTIQTGKIESIPGRPTQSRLVPPADIEKGDVLLCEHKCSINTYSPTKEQGVLDKESKEKIINFYEKIHDENFDGLRVVKDG